MCLHQSGACLGQPCLMTLNPTDKNYVSPPTHPPPRAMRPAMTEILPTAETIVADTAAKTTAGRTGMAALPKFGAPRSTGVIPRVGAFTA